MATTTTNRHNEQSGRPLTIGAVCGRLKEVPGRLHLQDSLPRGPGPARAAADAERLPPLHGRRRRAARDDPAAPARRVSPAARHPPGARLAEPAEASAPRRRLRAPERVDLIDLCDQAGVHREFVAELEEFGLLQPRGRERPAPLSGAGRRRRGGLCAAGPLRRRTAAPAELPDGRRARGSGSARAGGRAGAPLQEPEAPQPALEDLEALASASQELSQLLFWRAVRSLLPE